MDRFGEANTLEALGDLDRQEDRLSKARRNYGEALPIFREIRSRLGEANTLQGLALTDSAEGLNDAAVTGFQAAREMHEEIGSLLGARADSGYLGRHHMRNDAPREALQAFNVSIEILPFVGDPVGYRLSLTGLFDAFAQLNDVVGILACLRLLAVCGAESGERFENLMNAIKEQNPDTDYAALEEALDSDPEAVRRDAVRRALEEPNEANAS